MLMASGRNFRLSFRPGYLQGDNKRDGVSLEPRKGNKNTWGDSRSPGHSVPGNVGIGGVL